MSDLISRDYVLSEYDRQHNGPPGGARKIMEEAPAVDAVPVVHGNWKIMSHGFPPEPCIVCSNCGLDIDYEICKRIKADSFSYTSMKPNYCPNCGAKMDKEG
jgi:hypothetical protein